MNSKFLKVLQFFIFLLIGAVLLYVAFRGIDLDEVIEHVSQANYVWVALSLVFAVLALVFRSYRWGLLIEPIDEKPPVSNIFHAINVGYLANFAFPRIGEITRCGILNRTDKIPVDKLFGTVVVERIFDLLMSVLLLCLILLMRFDVVSGFIYKHFLQPLVNSTNIGRLLLTVSAISLIFFIIIKLLLKSKIINQKLKIIKEFFQGIGNGIKSIKRLRNVRFFIILNFLVFFMYFMQTYVLFFALPSTSSLGVGDALFILVLSALALIIPVQGGIGAYHGIISMGFTIFGLTRIEGMAYAVISHSVTAILFILLGAVSLIIVFGKKHRNEK